MGMVVVAFKVDEELLRRIDWLAAKNGVTRSDIIRAALAEYLRNGYRPKYRFFIKRVVIA